MQPSKLPFSKKWTTRVYYKKHGRFWPKTFSDPNDISHRKSMARDWMPKLFRNCYFVQKTSFSRTFHPILGRLGCLKGVLRDTHGPLGKDSKWIHLDSASLEKVPILLRCVALGISHATWRPWWSEPDLEKMKNDFWEVWFRNIKRSRNECVSCDIWFENGLNGLILN